MNRRPTRQSLAADAQRANDLRISRLQTRAAEQRAAGNHGDASDTDAFIEHLRGSGTPSKGMKSGAGMSAAQPRRRMNPRVAAASNAFAGMGQ